MASFEPKFEVQKGRTVTCIQGVVHAGGKLTTASFSGDNEEDKQQKIIALVKLGSLKPAPLTEAEEKAVLKAQEIVKANEEKKAKAKEKAEVAAADLFKAEKAAKAEKETAILDADFQSMNKEPMISFAGKWGIKLKSTLAEGIRTELVELQESLTAPE